MPKQSPRVHVTRPVTGGWNITPEGQKPVANVPTQAEALKGARDLINRGSGGGELITHDRQNRIRESDTLSPAKDPYPPKG